jgi:hypothetical protein
VILMAGHRGRLGIQVRAGMELEWD